MEDFYPPLPEKAAWTLAIILQNMEQDADYLAYSPYSAEDVQILQRFADREAEVIEEVEEDEELGDKWDRLESESNKLFKMLTKFSDKLDDRDNAETMAYFRTATSLLDKIVGIQERAANLKQINMFHSTVLNIMEDVLEPGQRTDVMQRLQNAIKPEA